MSGTRRSIVTPPLSSLSLLVLSSGRGDAPLPEVQTICVVHLWGALFYCFIFHLTFTVQYYIIFFVRYAAVAQLDRVTGYEPVGRGFESLQPYHVAASVISLAANFFMLRIKNSSRAHSAAPRFRTGFASLDSGSGWSEPNAFASKMLTLSVSPQASDRLRRFYAPDVWDGAFVGKAKRLCKQNAKTGQAKM